MTIPQKLKCRFGFHIIPEKSIFESMGAVFKGGVCPDCGKLKQKFLFNAWDEEEETPGGLFLIGTNPKLIDGIRSGSYIWDPEWYKQIDEALDTI